jgi:radical SAM superfamily enzyme YgiQ (UPF0313 family)
MNGIIFRDDGNVVVGPPAIPIEDLDSLPLPAVDLIPLKRYYCITLSQPFATVITSRGCPFRCKFCSQIYSYKRLRQRSPENVVEEIYYYNKILGIKELIMFDETFTVGKDRTIKLCKLILKNDLDVRWNIRTRADTLDEDVLRALKESGCHTLHIGVESGSNKILKRMGKDYSVEEVSDKFRVASNMGFDLRAYFMIGYMGEDERSLKETLRLSLRLPIRWASFSVVTPLPDTELLKDCLRSGVFDEDPWKVFTLSGGETMVPYVQPDGFKLSRLKRLQKKAYLRFYLRPSAILRNVKMLGSFKGIKDLISGLMILRSFK